MVKGLEILNEYFDKIYVITLKRSIDRQEKINKHFANVDFEYFYGIDKQGLDIQQLIQTNVYDPAKAKKLHRNNKEMFLGQIACSLSHRELYKKIQAEGFKNALIMEDDFVPINVDVPSLMKAIFEELPSNWDLIYLGYYLNESITFKHHLKQAFYKILASMRMIKWSIKQVKNIYPKKFSAHLKKAGYHNTTHAYVISAAAIPKLISAQTPVALCADTLLTELVLNETLNAFIVIPKIFNQEIFMEGGSQVSYITD